MSYSIILNSGIVLPEEISSDLEKVNEVSDYISDKLTEVIESKGCSTVSVISIEDGSKNKFNSYSIYRHFKGKYYASIDISTSIDENVLNSVLKFSEAMNFNSFKVQHTETKNTSMVVEVFGRWYHSSLFNREDLVLYKSLYDNEMTYARPKEMFLSPVDKEKYSKSHQEFRFELC